MSRTPTRIGKLVRLNLFREELATASLNRASMAQSSATEKHQAAFETMEDIGRRKIPADQGPLDISRYELALHLESAASDHETELKQQLEARESETGQAREGLIQATSALRVSENRNRRERAATEVALEKQIFEQISDVWLNNRVRRDD